MLNYPLMMHEIEDMKVLAHSRSAGETIYRVSVLQRSQQKV